MKRFLAGLTVVLMALTAVALISPAAAEAQNCNPPHEPSVVFVLTGEILTADALVDDFGGSIEAARDFLLTVTGATPDVEKFRVDAINWFNFLISGRCAPAVEYPGPFENHPTTAPGPYGFGTMNPVAAAADAVTADSVPATGTGGGELAHTGAESAVLTFVGLGLLGFGAAAMGTRRRIS